MRSNGPVATKELAMTGREWPATSTCKGRAVHRDIKKIFMYRSGRQHAIPPDWPKVAVWSAA
jgi:hypothetical protein